LGFGIGASVVTNNIAVLAALANGLLPMRKVAQLEAERRHLLEMQLRHSGFLVQDTVHPGFTDAVRGVSPPAGALAGLDGLKGLQRQWPIAAD
jgi:hypothetical protein